MYTQPISLNTNAEDSLPKKDPRKTPRNREILYAGGRPTTREFLFSALHPAKAEHNNAPRTTAFSKSRSNEIQFNRLL